MSFLERVNKKLYFIRIKIYVKFSHIVFTKDNRVDKYSVRKAKIPVIIRQITENDAEAWCEARSTNSKEQLLDRLSKGHIGMCAIHEGKIVSFAWHAIDEYWIEENMINLKLPSKHRYGFSVYTHPDYRRLGISHELRTTSYPIFVERGIPISIALIHSDNEASLRASEKTGGRRLGILHTKRFLGYVVFHSIESDNEENRKQIKEFFKIK